MMVMAYNSQFWKPEKWKEGCNDRLHIRLVRKELGSPKQCMTRFENISAAQFQILE